MKRIPSPRTEEGFTWPDHGDCNRAVAASFVIAANGVINNRVVTGRLIATIAPFPLQLLVRHTGVAVPAPQAELLEHWQVVDRRRPHAGH